MQYNSSKTLLSIFFVLLFISVFAVQAQTAKDTLNYYIVDLQKSPNDNALREKIIKHVQTMKPAPAIPEEAKKYMARGKAAFKGAKEINDFNDAASEFQKLCLQRRGLPRDIIILGLCRTRQASTMQQHKVLNCI